jgi:hypothetical protein
MKTMLLIIGFILAALILFILGLVPGEHFLSSPGADSYILVGIARFATWVTGFCEFVLGGVLVAVWIRLLRRTRMAAK